MKVQDARICLDCDGVFSSSYKCPYCASTNFHYLSLWVPSMRRDREEIAQASTAEEFKAPWFWRLPWIGRYFRPIEIAF